MTTVSRSTGKVLSLLTQSAGRSSSFRVECLSRTHADRWLSIYLAIELDVAKSVLWGVELNCD